MNDLIQMILMFLTVKADHLLPAAICMIALRGADPRICLVLTLWVHVALILI